MSAGLQAHTKASHLVKTFMNLLEEAKMHLPQHSAAQLSFPTKYLQCSPGLKTKSRLTEGNVLPTEQKPRTL